MGQLVQVKKGIAADYKTAFSAIYGAAGKGRRGKALATYGRKAAPWAAGSMAAAPVLGRGAGKLATRMGASEKQARGAAVLANSGTRVAGGLQGVRAGAKALRSEGFGKASGSGSFRAARQWARGGKVKTAADKFTDPQHDPLLGGFAARYGNTSGATALTGRGGRALPVHKASKDENSSPGASVTLRMPKVSNKATVVHAQTRSGAFAGKSRGVGRHLTRDENSSPGKAIVRTPSLREINGKFAGMGEGVKIFHPSGSKARRSPRDNRVQRWNKGAGDSGPWVKKSADDEPRKGMLTAYDLGSMQHQAGARVGRRIPIA